MVNYKESVPQSVIDFAQQLADASGVVALRYFRQRPEVEIKADQSPVTIADKEVEHVLRQMIFAKFPEHGILGEEHGSSDIDRECVWVIDPIDGTQSFILGSPLFGTLITLMWRNQAVLGVIDHPALGQRWVGARGHATRWNGEVVRVRQGGKLSESTLTTYAAHFYTAETAPVLERLRRATRFLSYGLECYSYGLLASGLNDLVIEVDMDVMDFLAAVPVVEGAGGVITDWQGQALTMNSGDKVLAAGDPLLHQRALEIIAG